LDYLEKEHIKQLRGVIITHLHADHYAEVADLLSNCTDLIDEGCEVLATTEEIIAPKDLDRSTRRKRKAQITGNEDLNTWMQDPDKHSEMYETQPLSKYNLPQSPLAALHQWSQRNKDRCEIIRATKRSLLPFSGTLVKSLQLVHPPFVGYHQLKMSRLNNTSTILRITGTSSSALLTGDLEPEGWKLLKSNYPALKSNVLKFPHHGGAWKEAETDDLLDCVQPSIVVISVGSNNTYDHPKAEVFSSLHKRNKLHLLCTQATNKCQQSVQNERGSITNKFQIESKDKNTFFISPKQGHCPCAGSIIIELGDEPRVLQPDSNFHESIINIHFQTHRCRIPSIISAVPLPAKHEHR
jgi:beta-lactamase superfamily II metal-dependent hydrolase